MRIAFVNQPLGVLEVPDPGSSLSIWIYEVARRLAANHQVTVFSRTGRGQAPFEEFQGVSYRRINGRLDAWMAQRVGAIRRPNPRRPLCGSRLYYYFYTQAVARQLQRQQAQVIHLLNFSQFVPIFRKFNPHAKIVLHMQCEWLTQMDSPWIAPRLAQADCIMGCSKYITGKIQQRYPQLAHRCVTVYNGVDLGADTKLTANNAADGPRLLFVGRISPEKGLHVLVDAFKIIRKSLPQAHLDIVGPSWVCPAEFLADMDDAGLLEGLKPFFKGNYTQQLKDRLTRDLAGDVVFLGSAPHSRVMGYYRDCDMLINASLSDASAMPLAEAMGCGVAVVATTVGGTPEIVHDGQTGLLIPPDDAPALAQAITRLWRDPTLRESMGQAGRSRAELIFDWDKISNHVATVYDNLGQNEQLAPQTEHAAALSAGNEP